VLASALAGTTAAKAVDPAAAATVAARLAKFARIPATSGTTVPQAEVAAESAVAGETAKAKIAADATPAGAVRTGATAPAAASQADAASTGSRRRDGRANPAVAAAKRDIESTPTTAAPAAAQPAVPTFAFAPPTAQAAAAGEATAAAAPSAPAEALIEHQLDVAADGEWLDQLARDIARAGGSEGRMTFRLNPEHLGTLQVELARGEQGTSVRLTADSEAARAMLADAQPRLVAEARAQGVRISETHVDLAGGNAGDSRRQDAERRDPLIRTARDSSPQEPAPRSRNGASSDRYA
jgi:flagellar hook-length control protein FliK